MGLGEGGGKEEGGGEGGGGDGVDGCSGNLRRKECAALLTSGPPKFTNSSFWFQPKP